ncbi:unnamed protein product [Rotaria sordida]|uniref:Uncharacterized protein n=2 Tax=Rotaria sordida TaxID=392033 RepID=A0A815GN24_9BILA|nr:unnamed protein product [Rotaria sordida]CAF4183803.1 unnamed protein product [Rotaria sordida]
MALSNDEKQIINETKPVSLDNLSPVVRQILSKYPSYVVRFVDDLILSINEDENDLPRLPIVTFPSVENQFEMDLGAEDQIIPMHETARYFGCGASVQCADKTKSGFIPVEIYKDYLSTNLEKTNKSMSKMFSL